LKRILVSGLINIEVTLRVDGFPISYTPVRYPFFGVNGTVSGVGYNVAKALTTLGADVRFLSLTGRDLGGKLVGESLKEDGIADTFVRPQMEQTPRSVILYDPDGRRQINVDLKNVQEQVYPAEEFHRAIEGCDIAVLCNVNFSRSLLALARERGVPVATDVHTVSDLEDDYNSDFMAAADVLFMSDELLPCPPAEWVAAVVHRYGPQIVVVGLGGDGVLMAVRRDGFVGRIPAVETRPVVNTIGAGDALFSAFVHSYAQTGNPYQAIRKAVVFSSYKIGAAGAAEGFLTQAELDALYPQIYCD
jgi:ribokinase